MFRIAALAVVSALLLAPASRAASFPKPKLGKLKALRSLVISDTRKGRFIRMGLGFAATTGTLAFRPGAGSFLPATTPRGPVITVGATQFGCSGCVGPDWSKGKP